MNAIRRATPLDLLLLATTMLIWAAAFVGIKVAVPAIGPVGVAAARATIGFAVLLPILLLSRGGWPGGVRDWGKLVLMAELNVAIPFTLISYAELTVSAGVAALVMGAGPLFAMIGAHYFNEGDAMTRRRALGVALGFGGIAIMVGPGALASLGAAGFGAIGALLLASLCYVASGLLVRRIDLPPLPMAVGALAIATVSLLPFAAWRVDGAAFADRTVLLALLFLGVFPTGVAYVLRFYLISRIGFATFALGVNMIPVFGVLLGVVVLDEALTWPIIAALALVVGGLAVARSGSNAVAAGGRR